MGVMMINGVAYGGDNSIICTQAEYDAWEQAGTLITDCKYYISDAPSDSSIQDNTTSLTTTWSSTKISGEIADVIDDTTASSSATYSSTKINTVISNIDVTDLADVSGTPQAGDLMQWQSVNGVLKLVPITEYSMPINVNKKEYNTASSTIDRTLCTEDTNGLICDYLYLSSSNGNGIVSIGSRDYWSTGDISHNVFIGVKSNGPSNPPAYMVSHPKALLDVSTSFGKLTNVAQATKNTTYISDSNSSVKYVRSGHIVQVLYEFSTKAAVPNRWTYLFTGLPKPILPVHMRIEGESLTISTEGALQNQYVISASTVFFRGSAVYITDDFS